MKTTKKKQNVMKEPTKKEEEMLKRFLKLKAKDIPQEKRKIFLMLEKPMKALIRHVLK